MSLRKKLDTEPVSRKKPKHPEGWEPGWIDKGDTVQMSGSSVGKPQPEAWRDLLREEGFDPDEFRIKGDLHIRRWQQRPDSRWVYYYKFTVERNDAGNWNPTELVKAIKKRPPLKRKKPKGGGGHALVVNLADWQAGADHGGGPDVLMERINRLGPRVVQRWRELRQMGVPLDTLFVHVMGDMGEGCGNQHYAMQDFTLHLDGEGQREFVVHALDMLLDTWAPMAPRVSVYAVPGNHGENRRGGKAFTTFRDNVDIGAVVSVSHAFSKNADRYGHVQFHTPPYNELSMTYEFNGFITGLIHGHQARNSGDVIKKFEQWWMSQMYGAQPIGDADLLVTAHYHHLRVTRQGVKTHMACPALCGRQDWWTNATGLDSPPGTLSYTISKDGWANLEVL